MKQSAISCSSPSALSSISKFKADDLFVSLGGFYFSFLISSYFSCLVGTSRFQASLSSRSLVFDLITCKNYTQAAVGSLFQLKSSSRRLMFIFAKLLNFLSVSDCSEAFTKERVRRKLWPVNESASKLMAGGEILQFSMIKFSRWFEGSS